MLAHLTIRDIVLIDHLHIAFQPGLTVLTGETGAGKSILLDALALALGARGDGGLVSSGQDKGAVSAAFELPEGHVVFTRLKEQDIASEGELILRRVQSADGRTRAYINDQPVSAALLRDIGARLIEIHGQHEERALVDSAQHRRLLDAFGALEAECKGVGRLYRSWQDDKSALEELQRQVLAGEREADYLRASIKELEGLAPQAGEEEGLAARRQTMIQAEKVMSELQEAHEAVCGAASPVPVLVSLMRRLERKSAPSGNFLDEIVAALDRSIIALEETSAALEEALQKTAFDPHELERVEERLFGLRAAARKYGVPVEGLSAFADKLAHQLEAIDSSAGRLSELQKATLEAEHAYLAAAKALSEKRREAAKALERAVAGELPALRLEEARFFVHLSSDEAAPTMHGIDKIAFWIKTNPGTKPGPLHKVASGGELSRVLLALKVALADKGSAPCLVFDEIDTGIGGAVAEAIGRRLARLGQNVQVLSITHAPQVAAHAGHHLVVEKRALAGKTRVKTAVETVSNEARKEEIARMLAGARITDEARAAAEKLIAETPL